MKIHLKPLFCIECCEVIEMDFDSKEWLYEAELNKAIAENLARVEL